MNRLALFLPTLFLLVPPRALADNAVRLPGAVFFVDFEPDELPATRLFHGARRVEGRFGSSVRKL